MKLQMANTLRTEYSDLEERTSRLQAIVPAGIAHYYPVHFTRVQAAAQFTDYTLEDMYRRQDAIEEALDRLNGEIYNLLGCDCGFYACWEPAAVRLYKGACPLPLFGAVEGYGRVIKGPGGFRCSRARILALALPGTSTSSLGSWVNIPDPALVVGSLGLEAAGVRLFGTDAELLEAYPPQEQQPGKASGSVI
jgi:hypothetical protein